MTINVLSPLVRDKMRAHLDQLIVQWHVAKGVRDGRVHASQVLQDAEMYCLREMILSIFFRKSLEYKYPGMLRKLHYGWQVHEVWQDLLLFEPEKEQEIEEFLELVKVTDPTYSTENTMDDYRRVRSWRNQFAVGKKLAVEVEKTHVVKKYNFSFTPDAIIEDELFNEKLLFIVEIKGYRPEVYDAVISMPNPMESYEFKKAAHQANLYMHMTGIAQALILFENKANQAFEIWIIKYDPEMAAPYVERMEQIMQFVNLFKEKFILPEKLSLCTGKDSERAQRCPMAPACFAQPAELWEMRREDWDEAISA